MITPSGITKIEEAGGFYFKRDDLALDGVPSGHPNGSKMRQYMHMIGTTKADVPLVVGCAAASAMQVYLASAAKLTGRKAVVYVAGRARQTGSTRYAVKHGAEVNEVRPGYMSVVRARARAYAMEHGAVRWDAAYAVRDACEQCANVSGFGRVVVPVGSGLTLVGVLRGLRGLRGTGAVVVGVAVSKMCKKATVRALWEKFWPGEPCPEFKLYLHPYPYDKPVFAAIPGGEDLDPYYAAKGLAYLRRGDLLWVPGARPPQAW